MGEWLATTPLLDGRSDAQVIVFGVLWIVVALATQNWLLLIATPPLIFFVLRLNGWRRAGRARKREERGYLDAWWR